MDCNDRRQNNRKCIDAALDDFVVHMKHKLLLTRHRKHWKHLPHRLLHQRVLEEAGELLAAIESGDRKAVVREAADVANFAMMVADNAQWSGTREWNSHQGR